MSRHWTQKVGLGILGALVALAIVGGALNKEDEGSDYGVPEPDAQTCANLQAAINGGMSKRDAIDFAIIQADEPGADDILRNMLYLC